MTESLSEKIEKEIKGFAEYIYGLSPHNFDFKIKENNYDIRNFVEIKLISLIKERDKKFIKDERRTLQEIFNEWEIDDDVVEWVFTELDKLAKKDLT